MSRFDYRSVDTFKKDVYFATQLEKYFFNKWLEICETLDYIHVVNPRDNGVNNDGEFIASGNTSGADYLVDINYHSLEMIDMPIEVKWVPTFGKFTLKVGDLKAYIRENAGILFIYPSEKTINLRKPKDYDLTKHLQKIESISQILKWSLMSPDQVKHFLEYAEEHNKIEKISYMGYKPGIILHQDKFKNWFTEEKWL